MGLTKGAAAIKAKVEQGQQAQLDRGIPLDRGINQLPGRALPPTGNTGQGYTPDPDAVTRVSVRKNSAGSVYSRRRLNLIEGTGASITVADDSGSEEIDITIALAGGGTLDITDGGTTVPAVTDLTLVGATITDDTGGAATLTVTGGAAPDAVLIVESQASGTDAGAFNNGSWVTRVLNTEKVDTGALASVASNQITLAAGTYRVRASAPGYQCGRHQARLYDITNSAVLLSGSSAFTIAFVQTESIVIGRITLAAPTVIELQHRCETSSATYGLGVASGSAFTVSEEIYASVCFEKE